MALTAAICAHVQVHVPRVNERAPILVSQRPKDCQLGQQLGAFVLQAVEELGPLIGMPGGWEGHGGVAQGSTLQAMPTLPAWGGQCF